MSEENSEENADDLRHIPQLAMRLRLLKQAEKRIHTLLSEQVEGKESDSGIDPGTVDSKGGSCD